MKITANYGVVKDQDADGNDRWILIAEFVDFPSELAAQVAMKILADNTREIFSGKNVLSKLQSTTALASTNGMTKQ